MLEGILNDLATLGVFNVLISDSDSLFVYCSTKLTWLTRQAPFAEASLTDADVSIDFKKETSDSDIVTVIATEPLTHNEQWVKMASNEFSIFRSGKQVYSVIQAND